MNTPEPMALVDRDGDLWLRRDDGWCCQALCNQCGVQHTCGEHDHRPLSDVESNWGPTRAAEEQP